MLEYVVYLCNVSLTYEMCHCPDLGSVTMLVHPGQVWVEMPGGRRLWESMYLGEMD